jgi:ubiquinone/menaquinone biosynthesis C-methylase UbiE
MDGSYPGNVRLWEGQTALAVQDLYVWTAGGYGETASAALPGPHNPADFAQRLFALEALTPPPAPARSVEDAEPYSLQWFLNIENQRHSRQGRWIPHLMEFAKHSGETLLGLGNGLGTDWLQYARHGAKVIVCSPSSPQLSLIRRNFELRGLPGRFIHAQPTSLPLDSASIDVVCISSLGQGPDKAKTLVDQVYRVLKPGGKVLAVTRARFDVDFWLHSVFFWYRFLGGGRRQQGTTPSYSRRELRRLFGRFIEHRIHKRQLRRSEVPHIWRWLPSPVLARLMGRVLVLKAFKPLSAAMNVQAAAA